MTSQNFRFKLNRWTIGGTLAAVTAAAVVVPSVYSQSRATIKIDGSSTVYPVTEAVAEDFQAKNRNTQVTVGISGTGGGFKKFCAGETDISNASRPIKESERKACAAAGIKYMELPIAFDALTVVANKQNTAVNSMTVAELKKLWEPAAQGKITKWNQVNPKFPDAPVKLYGPGADSGTFEYFTEAIVGESKKSRTDFTPSEDDNVLVQGVSRDKNALGYFGYAYYDANKDKLKAIAVDGGKGAVLPSRANVENGKYQPLSRPIFIYVNAKSAQRPEVKQFVEYYINNAPKLVAEVKYVPLPAATYQAVMNNFKKNKTGSVFVGQDIVGVTVQDIVRMEAKE